MKKLLAVLSLSLLASTAAFAASSEEVELENLMSASDFDSQMMTQENPAPDSAVESSAVESSDEANIFTRRHHDDVICYARNERGMTFHAVRTSASLAERRAMEACYRVSRYCRPIGCRPY